MNALTVIPTDLLTPLGAYLRLRGEGRRPRSCSSRSSTGRLGRHSFVGCGSRLVDFDEAERRRAPGRRLPRLRPRRDARADRPAPDARAATFPRAASSSPTRSSASTTRSGIAEVLAGDPDECRDAARERPQPPIAAGAGAPRLDPAAARQARLRARACVAAKEHIRAGRRLPDRPLAARRAADVGERARALPRAAARQPLAVPLPARARRARAGRLLARDAGQGRGPRAPA